MIPRIFGGNAGDLREAARRLPDMSAIARESDPRNRVLLLAEFLADNLRLGASSDQSLSELVQQHRKTWLSAFPRVLDPGDRFFFEDLQRAIDIRNEIAHPTPASPANDDLLTYAEVVFVAACVTVVNRSGRGNHSAHLPESHSAGIASRISRGSSLIREHPRIVVGAVVALSVLWIFWQMGRPRPTIGTEQLQLYHAVWKEVFQKDFSGSTWPSNLRSEARSQLEPDGRTEQANAVMTIFAIACRNSDICVKLYQLQGDLNKLTADGASARNAELDELRSWITKRLADDPPGQTYAESDLLTPHLERMQQLMEQQKHALQSTFLTREGRHYK